jgi:hypothetical protein
MSFTRAPAAADLGDELGVARAVEDDDGEVAHGLALGLGDQRRFSVGWR